MYTCLLFNSLEFFLYITWMLHSPEQGVMTTRDHYISAASHEWPHSRWPQRDGQWSHQMMGSGAITQSQCQLVVTSRHGAGRSDGCEKWDSRHQSSAQLRAAQVRTQLWVGAPTVNISRDNKWSGDCDEDGGQVPRDQLPILGTQQYICHENQGDKICDRSGEIKMLVMTVWSIIISVHCSSVLRLGPRGNGGWEREEEEGGEDAVIREDGQDG